MPGLEHTGREIGKIARQWEAALSDPLLLEKLRQFAEMWTAAFGMPMGRPVSAPSRIDRDAYERERHDSELTQHSYRMIELAPLLAQSAAFEAVIESAGVTTGEFARALANRRVDGEEGDDRRCA